MKFENLRKLFMDCFRKAVWFCCSMLGVYITVLVMCGYLLPIIGVYLAGLSGVTYETAFLDVLILFVFPMICVTFLVAYLCYRVIVFWANKMKDLCC